MQDKELSIEFVNFCDSQPKDKGIDHSTWHSCAVGEFFGWNDFGDEDFNKIAELLGDSGEFRSKIGNGFCPHNYGEFTQFLKIYL